MKKFDTPTASKCTRLSTPPGQHGLKRKKVGDYLLQLRAKQSIKYTYNILDRQFKNYFKKALRKKGNTGFLLLLLLETRLDNIVYRMGFATTRAEARQMVSHNHVLVSDKNTDAYDSFSQLNWKPVNIPSFQVKIGCFVGIKRSKIHLKRIQNSLAERKNEKIPYWITLNSKEFFGKLDTVPKRCDLPSQYNEQLVVELYSK